MFYLHNIENLSLTVIFALSYFKHMSVHTLPRQLAQDETSNLKLRTLCANRSTNQCVVSPTRKIGQPWNNFKHDKKRYFPKPFRK